MEKQAKILKKKLNDKTKEFRGMRTRANRSDKLCKAVTILVSNLCIEDVNPECSSYEIICKQIPVVQQLIHDIEESNKTL